MSMIVTLAQVKQELGVNPNINTWDAKLTSYILEATAWAENYCGRKFQQVTNHVQRWGVHKGMLFLDHYPDVVVSQIEVSDRQGTTEILDPYYYRVEADQGVIEQQPYNYGNGYRYWAFQDFGGKAEEITVTYTGGYIYPDPDATPDPIAGNVPVDLQRAIIDLTVRQLHWTRTQNTKAVDSGDTGVVGSAIKSIEVPSVMKEQYDSTQGAGPIYASNSIYAVYDEMGHPILDAYRSPEVTDAIY